MSIELARKLFAHSEKEWSVLNETIRKTVFELFAKGDFPLIFTYMCAFDMQSEFDYLQNVIDLFKSNGANCYVVELVLILKNVLFATSENRLLHKESSAT